MSLPAPKSLAQFQQDFLNNWAAGIGVSPASIPSSDPIVALGGSNSGAALYLQGLIYQLVALTRASTSKGPDLDSWLADFNYTRPQGAPATVTITFQVNPALAPGGVVTIPEGTVVQTQPIVVAPSTIPQVFQVETTQAYSFSASGAQSILCEATTEITIPNGGPTGYQIYNNIPANQLTQLEQPIAGVTSVTNAASPSGGSNNASDPAALAAFVEYITGLAKSNQTGINGAVEDAFSGLVLGQTFVTLTNAIAPTLVQPGQIWCVFVSPGKSGQYTGATFDPQAQGILNALVAAKAFGLTPLVYYANEYLVSHGQIAFTYSASALAAAGLSLSALELLMFETLQELMPVTGGQLGQAVPFSQIAAALLDISVTVSTGVISNIVTDVNLSGSSNFMLTTGGGTFNEDLIQPGTPSTLDQLGYLAMGTNPSAIVWYPTAGL
jgi:hypothetical protein